MNDGAKVNPYRENAAHGRVVCRFSCGAASAVATKLAIEQFGDRVHIINAFVADELDDNRRFLADCEKWLGRQILVVRDTQYGACAETVWHKRRFIAGLGGAPCSKILKRDVMQKHDLPSDTMVLGYTADKKDAKRLDDFIDANPEVKVIAPLIDAGITKQDCFGLDGMVIHGSSSEASDGRLHDSQELRQLPTVRVGVETETDRVAGVG